MSSPLGARHFQERERKSNRELEVEREFKKGIERLREVLGYREKIREIASEKSKDWAKQPRERESFCFDTVSYQSLWFSNWCFSGKTAHFSLVINKNNGSSTLSRECEMYSLAVRIAALLQRYHELALLIWSILPRGALRAVELYLSSSLNVGFQWMIFAGRMKLAHTVWPLVALNSASLNSFSEISSEHLTFWNSIQKHVQARCRLSRNLVRRVRVLRLSKPAFFSRLQFLVVLTEI